MDNKLQFDLKFEPSLSYSYSTSNDTIISVGSININLDFNLGKNSSGYCRLDWKELLTQSSKFHRRDNFEKEALVKVYEKMIQDLNEQIKILKK
jgi:hypothetical protein